MKVKRIRLNSGCHALKGGDVVVASDKVKIEMIGGGNFLVHREDGEIVYLPANKISFALCEPDQKKK